MGEAVGEVRRRASTSETAQRVRDALGLDTSDAATKDLVQSALVAAAKGSGAGASLVRSFAANRENRAAIVEMIADPGAAPTFRTSMGRGPQQRKQLDLLGARLREAIEAALDERLSPEGRRVLRSVEGARDALRDDLRGLGDRADARFDQLGDQLSALQEAVGSGSGGLSSASGDETDEGSPVADAERAFEEGRHMDARRLAAALVAEHEGVVGGDRAETLRRAHNVLARVALADPHTAAQALPHLEAVLQHWDGTEEGRGANRAVVRLLSGDADGALREAETALRLDPENETARSAKANALSHLGRPAEAAALFDADTADALGTRAWFLRVSGAYAEARETAREALAAARDENASGRARTFPALVLAETVLLELAPDFEYGPRAGTEEQLALLAEAEAVLDDALASLDDQRPSTRADALLYRATIRAWRGEGDVVEGLREAVRLQPTNERAVRNLVVALMERGDAAEASPHAERLRDLDGSAEAARLAVSVRQAAGGPGAGVEALSALAEGFEADPDAAEAAIQLADAYAQSFRTAEAEDLLDRVEASGQSPFGVAMARARHAMWSGRTDVAIEALDRIVAQPRPSGGTEEAERRALGRWRAAHVFLSELLFRSGGYRRVIDLLGVVDRPDAPGDTTVRRAASYLNVGESGACLALCERALAATDDGDLRLELETIAAAALMNLDAFVDAVERYARVLPGHPDRTRDLVAYGTALVRLGQSGQALDVLRVAEARVAGDASGLAVVGNAYMEAGDVRRSLELAYAALELAPEDERMHRNFAGLFIFHGDAISAAGPLDGKYLAQFHDILHHHAERFPEADPFVWLEKDPEDPEELRERMVELVRPRHEALQKVRTTFLKGGQAPLGAVGSLLGRGPLETWQATVSDPEWGRHAYPGDVETRDRSVKTGGTADRVVADPSALLTLHGLGWLEEGLASFDEVLVPQAFVDEVRHALDTDRASDDGKKYVLGLDEDGETLVMTEIAPEVVARERGRLEALYGALTRSALDPGGRLCRIIGRSPDRDPDVGRDDRDAFVGVVGEPAAEAAFEAEARGLPLLSDGVVLRRAVEREGGGTTDSYAVLSRLKEAGALDEVAFDDALLQLSLWGYRYVSMRSSTLLRSTVRERGLLTARSRAPFDYLVREGTNPESALGVLGAFVVQLWNTDMTSPLPVDTVRRQWTALAFATLARITSPEAAVDRLTEVSFYCVADPLEPTRWRLQRDYAGGITDGIRMLTDSDT